jgi:N6-adenosine-specific RNA methylase IME4
MQSWYYSELSEGGGNLFKPSKTMIQQIIAEPIREHSRKPDITRERIEEMYPSLSKIELFARTTKE